MKAAWFSFFFSLMFLALALFSGYTNDPTTNSGNFVAFVSGSISLGFALVTVKLARDNE